MPNKSKEENAQVLLEALFQAGTKGLSIDEAQAILFPADTTKKSATKKIVEFLKSKGQIRTDYKTGRIFLTKVSTTT